MKQLLTYLHTQMAAITGLSEKRMAHYTPDTFHDLRVSIKKIRAVVRLSGTDRRQGATGSYLTALRKLFKQAGCIRELQLEIGYIGGLPPSMDASSFSQYLEAQLAKEKSRFLLLKKNIEKALRQAPRELELALTKMNREETKTWLDKKIRRLAKKADSGYFNKANFHLLRKRIKALHYAEKAAGLKNKKISLPSAERISDELGKWHDACVVSDHLIRAKQRLALNTDEQHCLDYLHRHWQKKAKKHLQTSGKLLPSVFR
ncbi:CHAD domain-containing protein [Sediminibacterium soli]|uniref:CHAD domain-containing protein n=1 Tax=Sediminibacterium soli TaxID=2698829 RepID=UPI00137AE93A|nr:CHAD domain-containing protein [Sediminibacterium soli]NCI46757.1 CHAD domain-containing protein [Sediminibacterium soli]